MADTPKVYVICDSNCKWEGMTKEQIYAAITQAVQTGTIGNCDTGFITTIKTINGKPLRFFAGGVEEYNALTEAEKQDLFAIFNVDATKDDILKAIENLKDGTDQVHSAKNADFATEAGNSNTSNSAAYATVADRSNGCTGWAEYAICAVADEDENIIKETYAKKEETAFLTSVTYETEKAVFPIGSILVLHSSDTNVRLQPSFKKIKSRDTFQIKDAEETEQIYFFIDTSFPEGAEMWNVNPKNLTSNTERYQELDGTWLICGNATHNTGSDNEAYIIQRVE